MDTGKLKIGGQMPQGHVGVAVLHVVKHGMSMAERAALGVLPADSNAQPLHGEAAEGEVSMVLLLRNGSEVEVKLPGRFKVSPQIAGAIKAVSGVVTVEAL